MYRRVIKPVLFSLTIEQAHHAVLLLLRIIGLIPGGRWLLRKCYAVEHPALEREVFGIRFANPIGLAAGFDHNGEAFRELAALGFGFVEVGTVTPRPQAGNPRPRVFRLPKDNAIINRIGLANRGLEATIRHLRRPHDGVIVGCNIACREGTTHTREHILQILNPLFDFRRGQNQFRPIMLKISPDMSDEVIDQITDVLLETPLDGIVATNGTHSRGGLHTSRTTLEKIGSGRLSGAPLTHRAVEIVRRVHTRSGGTYPIIGVGGLMSAGDVRAMLDAGADLVQLYTGYVYNGPGMVKAVCRELIAAAEKPAAMRAAGESVQNGENPEASAPEAVGTAGKASDGESEEERRPGSGQK